jgi:hypothetical protein
MSYAEFEEKEYEGPLNMELIRGSRNLWTPGLVFEYHFGIDAALLVKNRYFWQIMGHANPPIGVSLPGLKLGYLWKALGFARTLPAFDMNLFLQVKRPFVVRKPRGVFTKLGYTSPFWRFAVTGHQQRALQKLAAKIGNNGLVSYGCAAFDSLTELYVYIPSGRIVDNSTFVKATHLTGHKYWAYDSSGTSGYACSEPELKKDEAFLEQIESIAAGSKASQQFDANPEYVVSQLRNLAKFMYDVCQEEIDTPDLIPPDDGTQGADSGTAHARFYVENVIGPIPKSSSNALLGIAASAYHDIILFCNLFNVHWQVIH